jgi:hypothetical protein
LCIGIILIFHTSFPLYMNIPTMLFDFSDFVIYFVFLGRVFVLRGLLTWILYWILCSMLTLFFPAVFFFFFAVLIIRYMCNPFIE